MGQFALLGICGIFLVLLPLELGYEEDRRAENSQLRLSQSYIYGRCQRDIPQLEDGSYSCCRLVADSCRSVRGKQTEGLLMVCIKEPFIEGNRVSTRKNLLGCTIKYVNNG